MNLFGLAMREMRHSRLTAALCFIASAAAAAVLSGQFALLELHDMRTSRILEEKSAEVERGVKKLEDDMRRLMLKLGLNLFIIPAEQNLDDFYAGGYASHHFPQNYMRRLSESNIVTVRHLLPMVEKKVQWPERGGRTIILIGIKGEVPFTERAPKKPIVHAVPQGGITLGYELWDSLGIETGDSIKLMGREFTVHELHGRRGTKDDISAWVGLETAQDMLGLEGRLSGIMALQCFCHGSDLESLSRQIPGILPGTRVIMFRNEVTTRARARAEAAEAGAALIRAERERLENTRQSLESNAAVVIPFTIFIFAALVVLLTYKNTLDRKRETGLLRAVGFSPGQVIRLYVVKSVALSFAGALCGVVAGAGIVLATAGDAGSAADFAGIFDPVVAAAIVFAAPALAAAAAFAPAAAAASPDPSRILSGDRH